jgi:hypothetical protein
MPKILKIILIAYAFGIVGVEAQDRLNLGWAEKIQISPGGIVMHAKLDTGADYSSLNANHIEEFVKEVQDPNPKSDKESQLKQKWVRFNVVNRYGQNVTIERPIRRFATIKRHGMKSQKRPVVRLGMCIGKNFMEEDVNLVDRTQFEYQMLVGRSFLAGVATVDPSMTYTTNPECKESKN